MKNIKLLDSKFENIGHENFQYIEALAELVKYAKKLGIEWYDNIEYHQEHGYINFSILSSHHELNFQVLIKEREIYFRYPQDNTEYNKLPSSTLLLIGLLGNQNAKSHKFYTNDAVMIFLSTIDQTLR